MDTSKVVCIQTDEHASLKVYGIYNTLPDEVAAKHKLIRVIDESGEDYLYPESYFVPSHIHIDQLVPLHAQAVSGEREFGLSA